MDKSSSEKRSNRAVQNSGSLTSRKSGDSRTFSNSNNFKPAKSFNSKPSKAFNSKPSYVDIINSLEVMPDDVRMGAGFENLVGVDHIKTQIYKTILIPNLRPDLYVEDQLPSRNILLYGPSGTGKCITGETYVLTADGLQQIGSLYNTNENESDIPMEVSIETFDESNGFFKHKTSDIYQKKAVPIKKIKTQLGIALSGTPHHRIITLSNKGELIWKTMDELQIGDIIPIRRGSNIYGSKTQLSTINVEWSNKATNRKEVDLPQVITEELGYLLGLLVGDGSLRLSKNTVRFSNGDKTMISLFEDTVSAIYSVGVKKYSSPNSSAMDLQLHSKVIKQHLQSIGLLDKLSYEKEVPFSVLSAPVEVQTSFLRGLFDTDGSISPNNTSIEVSFSTSSKKLITQVQLMLLNMGIVSRTVGRKTPVHDNYQLVIYNDFILLFSVLIGFNHPKKKSRLNKFVSANKVKNTNVNVLPNVSELLKSLWYTIPLQIRSDHGHTSRKSKRLGNIYSMGALEQNMNGRTRPSISRLILLLEYFTKIFPEIIESPLYSKLLFLCTNFFFTSIVSIDDSTDDVFDFVVPTTHSFVANGIVNHNTEIARAIAKDIDGSFYSINNSVLAQIGGGVTEGRKGLIRLMEESRKKDKPVILFIDEAEQMLFKRNSGQSNIFKPHEDVVNEMLTQVDGLTTGNDNIYIIAATNFPSKIEEAFLDRAMSIPVPLPNEDARKLILERTIAKLKRSLSDDVDLEQLVIETDGYSGRGIGTIVKMADGKRFDTILDNANANTDNLKELLKGYQTPPMEMADFLEAIYDAPVIDKPEMRKSIADFERNSLSVI